MPIEIKRREPTATRPGLLAMTKGALDDIRSIFGPFDREEISQLAMGADPINHPVGNRRKGELVFNMKGDVILGVGYYSLGVLGREVSGVCRVCFGSEKIIVNSSPEGRGKYSEVRCPACRVEKTEFKRHPRRQR